MCSALGRLWSQKVASDRSISLTKDNSPVSFEASFLCFHFFLLKRHLVNLLTVNLILVVRNTGNPREARHGLDGFRERAQELVQLHWIVSPLGLLVAPSFQDVYVCMCGGGRGRGRRGYLSQFDGTVVSLDFN